MSGAAPGSGSVIGERLLDQPVRPEEEYFRCEAPVGTSIVNDDTSYSSQRRYAFKVKVWDHFQGLFPIGPNFVLALKSAGGFTHDLCYQGRRHLEPIGVVRENAIEVVRIPCFDPFSTKRLREFGCDSVHGQCEWP